MFWFKNRRPVKKKRRSHSPPTPALQSNQLAFNVEHLEERRLLSATTTISVTAPLTTLTFGQTEALTAHVASSTTPNEGSVTFLDGSTTLGTQPVSGGTATLNSGFLPAGTDVISASYADMAGNFSGSTTTIESGITITVHQATPGLTVTDASGSYSGLALSATAKIAGVVSGVDTAPAASLEGVSPSLSYYSGAIATGTALSGAPSTVGTYTVVASFAGSTDYKAANSAAAIFSITKGAPVLTVTPATGAYNGSAFVATETVVPVGGIGTTSLEGVTPSLTYYRGITVLSGARTVAGNYSVVASFAGSTDYTSTSTSISFSIAKATPTVAVSNLGGTANGTTTFPATSTVVGVGASSTPASSLEGVAPTLQYYAGTSAAGNDWTSAAPNAPGTYTVLATFQGRRGLQCRQRNHQVHGNSGPFHHGHVR